MLSSQKDKPGKESNDLTEKHPEANGRPWELSFDRYK
jgi:hypothetical protein